MGRTLGPIDLSLLPIGAYAPREIMASVHASPEDAVGMHLDTRSVRSIGMHWGTFPLTPEPTHEPVTRLAAAALKARLPSDAFVAVKVGATVGATEGAAPDSIIVA